MFEKQGKFFADWRDQHGQRKRKSFHTERAALTFEAEQAGRGSSRYITFPLRVSCTLVCSSEIGEF